MVSGHRAFPIRAATEANGHRTTFAGPLSPSSFFGNGCQMFLVKAQHVSYTSPSTQLNGQGHCNFPLRSRAHQSDSWRNLARGCFFAAKVAAGAKKKGARRPGHFVWPSWGVLPRGSSTDDCASERLATSVVDKPAEPRANLAFS